MESPPIVGFAGGDTDVCGSAALDIALLGLHCRVGSSALLDTLILYAAALSLAATVGDVDGLLLSVVLTLSERFFAVVAADSLRSPMVAVSTPLPPFSSFGCVL